jgi:wyosine [tRNA(Phe)-imidazoG37] synthetase (radical SAM superfamily)
MIPAPSPFPSPPCRVRRRGEGDPPATGCRMDKRLKVVQKAKARKQADHYVYGPVPSRRLGHSLGVDLVPLKTCTYDCIYCQLGRTPVRTIDRKSYLPVKRVIEQLEKKLSSLPCAPDYITLSGSGEPTLHSEIGGVIRKIKTRTQVPLAVLTNGSLLHLAPVRKALLPADVVIPSFDAGNARLFRFINRPHGSLGFGQVLAGLKQFRQEYPGKIWLEVMLCRGINDDEQAIERIREEAMAICPDKIQLNTVIRPPAEDFAYPLSREKLEDVKKYFADRAEVIAAECPSRPSKVKGRLDGEILAMLERRPCSLQDVATSFGISGDEAHVYLRDLIDRGRIRADSHNQVKFYAASGRDHSRAGRKPKNAHL